MGRRLWSEIRRKGEGTPERRAQIAARMRQLGDAMGQHTVEVEVSPVEWGDDDRLGDLLDALAARPELLGPAVGADLSRRDRRHRDSRGWRSGGCPHDRRARPR